jgi:hypothetical protein
MVLLSIFLTGLVLYFAKEAFEKGNIKSAMFWSALLGWNLHTLLYII